MHPENMPFANLDIITGPVAGTQALARPTGALGLGYSFISSFPGNSPVDLRNIADSINGQNNYIDLGYSRPLGIYSGLPVQPLPALIHPERAARNFDSFTFEFIGRGLQEELFVIMNNVEIRIIYLLDFGMQVYVALSGAKGTSLVGDYFLGAVEQVWVDMYGADREFSNSKDRDIIGVYVNGNRIYTVTTSSDYWDRYCVAARGPTDGFPSFYLLNIGDLPIIAKVFASPSTDIGATRSSVHGLRFTPRALYTTPTITPPTSITTLA